MIGAMKSRRGPLLATIAAVVLILPSQLALNNPWLSLGYAGVGVFVGLSVCIMLTSRYYIPHQARGYLVYLIMLCSLGAASALVQGWAYPLVVYGAFASVIGIALLTFTPLPDYSAAVKSFVKTVAITTTSIVIASLIDTGFTMHRYQGIFNNSNSMGWFAASSLSLFIGAYLSHISWKRSERFMLLLLSAVLALFLLASQARAAAGAVIAGSVAACLPTVWRAGKTRRIPVGSAKRIGSLLLVVVLGLSVAGALGFLQPMIEKFQVKSMNGSPLGDRLDAWSAMVTHWTFFGLGPNYAEIIDRSGKTVGHSVFLSQLARYGVLPAVAFYGLLLFLWLKAFRMATVLQGSLSVMTLSVLTPYLVQGLFSYASASPGIWMAAILVGLMMAEEKARREVL